MVKDARSFKDFYNLKVLAYGIDALANRLKYVWLIETML
jgi:hypothetical protein